jgi:hypothetical protein
MRTHLPIVVAACLFSYVPDAIACFPGVTEFLAPNPGQGATSVPRDAGIQLSWTSPWGTTGWCHDVADYQVVVRDTATQEVIPGTLDMTWKSPFWCDGAIFAVWQPATPMPPQTVIAVETSFSSSYDDTSTSLTSSFATGDQFLPDLVMAKPPQVSYAVRVWSEAFCMQPMPCGGGGGCNPPETRRGVIARMSFGPIEGGQAELGYQLQAVMGEDAAPSIDEGPFPTLGIGSSMGGAVGGVVEMPLFDIGRPYVPCFAARVRDASGKTLDVEPFCLEQVDPAALLDPPTDPEPTEPDPTEPDPTDPDPANPANADDTQDTGGSCAVGPARRSASGAWLALLLSMFFAGHRIRATRR